MPTTTFADIKFTEDVENYIYENEERNFYKGEIVSLPRHTASRFVNKWNKAEWAKPPYEVRDEEYEEVLCRKVEENNSTAADWLRDKTVSEVEENVSEKDEKFLESALEEADRKGVKEAIKAEIE